MATAFIPSSLQAQITRRAISPRFAMRIFLNMNYVGTSEKLCGCHPGRRRCVFLRRPIQLVNWLLAEPSRLPTANCTPTRLTRPNPKQWHTVLYRAAVVDE